MKILDRYIAKSIITTFLFSIGMFMALLLAMDMLGKLIEMVTEQGIPISTALTIFALRLPLSLMYAFPMSLLLSILLVFNQMSSDSEMVAIRSAGVSFLRIIQPTLIFAVLVCAGTLWIADSLSPACNGKATEMTKQAIQQAKTREPLDYLAKDDVKHQRVYSLTASDFNYDQQTMRGVTVLYFQNDLPDAYLYAESAAWSEQEGRWTLRGTTFRRVKPNADGAILTPIDASSRFLLRDPRFSLRDSPFKLSMARQNPEDLSSAQIRQYIAQLAATGKEVKKVRQEEMRLAQRYAVPFTSLVFALIAAPLGLRHHRTSSAMGLGVSLMIIFLFYLVFHYLQVLGDDGVLPPILAAWIPNIIGGGVGVGLIIRANQ